MQGLYSNNIPAEFSSIAPESPDLAYTTACLQLVGSYIKLYSSVCYSVSCRPICHNVTVQLRVKLPSRHGLFTPLVFCMASSEFGVLIIKNLCNYWTRQTASGVHCAGARCRTPRIMVGGSGHNEDPTMRRVIGGPTTRRVNTQSDWNIPRPVVGPMHTTRRGCSL